MPDTKQKFSFTIQGFDDDAFHVARFTGEEGLSMLYRFEIVLYAKDKSVDFDKALSRPAVFTIKRPQGDIPFHGILASLEQLSRSGPHTFLRAILTPKAWWLTQTTHNQVFLQQSNREFLSAVLRDGGLSQGIDFSFSLMNTYPTWDYVCQYGESHFAFVSRWLERGGLYFYFVQGESGERMAITDSLTAHAPMPQGGSFRYSPPTSMQAGHEEEVITDFTLHQKRLPQKVTIRDYHYETPSQEIQGEALVKQGGQGNFYTYGPHVTSSGMANALAHLRAQALLCREKVYTGVSSIPFVRPGYTFELSNHFTDAFNQKYQTISCRHEGSQEAWLVSGLGLAFDKEQAGRLFYRNTFRAIPATVQFRAEVVTPRPSIAGSLPAKVDAEGSGKYAEVDSQGRYKVILPFDLSGRKDGRASAWLRMAQPYAGQGHGMHFPLHKGAEVLLTFLDGDPDRPVIAAAVPNPETASPINDSTQTQARITTSGGNLIHFEDQEGSQRILLSSPTQQSYIRIGSHNDPEDSGGSSGGESGGDSGGDEEEGGVMDPDGLKLWSGGPLTIKAQASFETILGTKNELILGLDSETVILAKIDAVFGGLVEYHLPTKWTYSSAEIEMKEFNEKTYATKVEVGDTKDMLLEEQTALVETVVSTINDDIRVINAEMRLANQRVQAVADDVATRATKNELTAAKEEVTAASQQAIAEKTSTLATKNELAASVQQVATSVEQVAATVNTQAASLTNMTAQVSTLSENVSVLSTAVEYL